MSIRTPRRFGAFDGFYKLYREGVDDTANEESKLLPPMTVGESLQLNKVEPDQHFTEPPPRYTEASLVKKLEALGIGRPSTYAPTISTVQKRGYVVKENREGTPRPYKVLTLKNGEIKSATKTENTGAEKSKLFQINGAKNLKGLCKYLVKKGIFCTQEVTIFLSLNFL